MPSSRQWVFGSFRLDPANACLWHGVATVVLQPKAFSGARRGAHRRHAGPGAGSRRASATHSIPVARYPACTSSGTPPPHCAVL